MSDCGGDCGGDGGTCDGGADTGGDCCDTGYSGGYEDSSGWGNDNYTHCGKKILNCIFKWRDFESSYMCEVSCGLFEVGRCGN